MIHTLSITLGNGDKGEFNLDMPDSADDESWLDRVSEMATVNDLAISNWTIAVQSGMRKCATLEDAAVYLEDYTHGIRRPASKKVVIVDATLLELTAEQIASFEQRDDVRLINLP